MGHESQLFILTHPDQDPRATLPRGACPLPPAARNVVRVTPTFHTEESSSYQDTRRQTLWLVVAAGAVLPAGAAPFYCSQ